MLWGQSVPFHTGVLISLLSTLQTCHLALALLSTTSYILHLGAGVRWKGWTWWPWRQHRWLSQLLVLAWRQKALGGEQGFKVKQPCWKALFVLVALCVLCHVGMNRAKPSECCSPPPISAWKLDLPLWHSSLGVKAVCKCSLVSLSRYIPRGWR